MPLQRGGAKRTTSRRDVLKTFGAASVGIGGLTLGASGSAGAVPVPTSPTPGVTSVGSGDIGASSNAVSSPPDAIKSWATHTTNALDPPHDSTTDTHHAASVQLYIAEDLGDYFHYEFGVGVASVGIDHSIENAAIDLNIPDPFGQEGFSRTLDGTKLRLKWTDPGAASDWVVVPYQNDLFHAAWPNTSGPDIPDWLEKSLEFVASKMHPALAAAVTAKGLAEAFINAARPKQGWTQKSWGYQFAHTSQIPAIFTWQSTGVASRFVVKIPKDADVTATDLKIETLGQVPHNFFDSVDASVRVSWQD